MDIEGGRARAVIEGVTPEIDGGRFPIKRVIGDKVVVEADIFADGFDCLSAVLLYRHEDDSQWSETPMRFLDNDRWQGSFTVARLGRYRYTIMARVDRFATWRQYLNAKVQAGQDVSVEASAIAEIIAEDGRRASDADAKIMQEWTQTLSSAEVPVQTKVQLAVSEQTAALMSKYSDRHFATTYRKELTVVVDCERAGFGAWYEMFPRSTSSEPGRHGTFKDCEASLPYISSLGFDVLYLPPIHPIGHTNRKGRNNTPAAAPDDPGSVWAVGSEEGGHKAVHPQLGTLEDFQLLIARAKEYSIEIALDISFHCSPDHPYVKEHPEWFLWLPDGKLRHAENPPNRYEDIVFFNFETENWRELWEELKSIVLFWIEQSIRIFRVDNPHNKPFRFWEWLISEVKKDYPNVIFLAEAFTRPKVMYRLSKLGFTQSYTYFAWRNTKAELTQYFNELTKTEVSQYFTPSLWTNTQDNLTPSLQNGGRPAFMTRLVLAATLGANYGIYGPAFELCENRTRPGSEEYMNSENYEIKHWDIEQPDSLQDFIAQVNRIRKENPALHSNRSLRFHDTDNEHLICYSKQTEDLSSVILVVVNLDPHHTQWGYAQLSLEPLGLDPNQPYQVLDLLNDARYIWNGSRNYVEINPNIVPAHIFSLGRR